MTKVLKNICISLCGIFAFLFAGFFFTGCGIDYNKISLTCDKQTVSLEVGESVDLTFSIENFQNGFSNKIDYNDQSSGMTEIFSCSAPKYIDESHISVTVTGVAGGEGKLEVRTLEAGKTCSVNISVEQYSDEMSSNSDILYVSNKTSFAPSANFYNFATNTTNKQLSYYYIKETQDIDFNLYTLKNLSFNNGLNAVFVDGLSTATLSVVEFDKAELDDQDVLKISLGGVEVGSEQVNEFKFIAVYDHSMNQDGSVKEEIYDNILYAVSTVYVLPDLEVEISGGYLDKTTGAVEFKYFDSESIKIVPNNSEMNVFVMKVAMTTSLNQLSLESHLKTSNNYVDVDFLKDQNKDGYFDGYYEKSGDEFIPLEKKDNVFYLKITQNSQTQVHTDVDFGLFYDKAEDINDESVNVEKKFGVDVQIAPVGLLVNGEASPTTKTLYNYYKFPEYGWNELVFDVISGLESSPNFEGIYFKFDESSLEVMCDGINVSSDPNGEGKLYSDLSKSFYVRGAYGCQTTEEGAPVTLTACLKSDILQGGQKEISVDMKFDIVAGARLLAKSEEFADVSTFYLDIDAGEKSFINTQTQKGVLYADAEFQFITYNFDGGVDVVDIACDTQKPYIKVDGENIYYLNLKIIPKAEGVGLYTINLDNGMPVQLTFNVTKTLNTDDAPFVLANVANEAVTDFRYAKDKFTDGTSTEDVDYNNILYIDVLNASEKGLVEYGSTASINLVANTSSDNVKFSVVDGNITRSQNENVFHFSTVESGVVVVNANVTGYQIGGKFEKISKTAKYEIRLSSYSLLHEFYLTNGGNVALSSTVYYGQRKGDSEKSTTFETYVDNENAFGFEKYDFTDAGIVNAYENSVRVDGQDDWIYSSVSADDFGFSEKSEFYDDKFVYFRLQNNDSILSTKITAIISKSGGERKKVTITNPAGWMFYAETRDVVVTDADGKTCTYNISFESDERIFYTMLGSFDVKTMTYQTTYDIDYSLRLLAHIKQQMSNLYEVKIVSQKYQTIDSISLGTSLTSLDFSNDNREHELSVYTYPLTSTSKKIRAFFVPTLGNPYEKMLNVTATQSGGKDSGIYLVKLSCEDFFNDPELRGGKDIVDIEESLTGKVYIFPAEWGTSVSEIDADLVPIVIDVQYRNGSKNNPYLIETVADLKNINQSETTLRSHYELNTVLDMSNESDFTPIGILNGEVVGFSGSIVGANSQAAISNISITNSNFAFVQSGAKTTLYGGLFAQINDGALIQNITFSGNINLTLENDAYVAILSAVNRGKISNVATVVSKSTIVMKSSGKSLFFGAISGINVGTIEQNFNLYDKSFDLQYADETSLMADYVGYNYQKSADGTSYVYHANDNGEYEKIKLDDDGKVLPKVRDLSGQQTKILTQFNDFVTITAKDTFVYAGGISGASSGTIERIWSEKSSLKLYGYSAYSAYTQIKAEGSLLNGGAVNLGGAVGMLAFGAGAGANSIPVGDKQKVENGYYSRVSGFNNTKNLLVGGEVDSTGLSTSQTYDRVGGLVGYVDTIGVDNITILNNTTRTFVRGRKFVGGLVGYEQFYNTSSKMAIYNNNLIEAIDDGRNIFYSSMIIKVEPFDSSIEIQDGKTPIAIGGSSGRSYSSAVAQYISYLERDLVELGTNDIIYSNLASTNEYYGDYLVIKQNGSAFEYVVGCKQVEFEKHVADIGIDDTKTTYKMNFKQKDSQVNPEANVYFMYYFSVDGYLSTDKVVDPSEISALNVIGPDSKFYPFALTTGDVTISTSDTHILSIDLNGIITVNGAGLATLRVTSIKNSNKAQNIYIYVVNYFDKDVKASLFYSKKSSTSTNLTDGSLSVVYGDSKSSIYLVPTYKLGNNESEFSITQNGILNFNNVNYVISKNNQMTVFAEQTSEGLYFSKVEILNQIVKFSKQTKQGDLLDEYNLLPKLEVEIEIDGQIYVFVYELVDASINLNVEYREKATRISTNSDYTALKTNQDFSDSVFVESVNQEEMLFYQIFFNGELIQNRLPESVVEITDADAWTAYINKYAENANGQNFFKLRFGENKNNSFDFNCEVNQDSTRFANRFNQNIYGEYKIYFYSSDLGLDGGVCHTYTIDLAEAEVNYVKAKNYESIKQLGNESDRLVPNERGLLEIVIDPIEAVFDDIVVSNSAINYNEGVAEARFTFVYEKVTTTGVEYVFDEELGTFKDGAWKLTYLELVDFINAMNKASDGQYSVSYTGKIFLSYYMPAKNVSDMMPVAFDIVVNFGGDNKKTDTVELTTKLSNYAKLSFNDKVDMGGVYYVARGLSYDLTLSSFGFLESEIQILSSNEEYAQVVKNGDDYVLNISSNTIPYNGTDVGHYIEIKTLATKIVDDTEVFTEDILKMYIMEYTLNYNYIEGVNEDIVKGMQDGVISTAIGNPFTLEFDIYNFVEYDKTNAEVVQELSEFVVQMTPQITWKVVYNDKETQLNTSNDIIKTDYYSIENLTVTPLKIYSYISDIYSFSMNCYYTIKDGKYSFSPVATENRIYTEFAFDVHEQSSQDSPIPVETYEDFMQMADGEWYILLDNIILPSAEIVSGTELEEFKPIKSQIAGLDGNGYKIYMGGTYNFSGLSDVGIFETVSKNTVLQNLIVEFKHDTVFKMDSTFEVGIIASQNDGKITNCVVQETNNSTLSVVSSVSIAGSYVSGLVSTNNGYITHSRSSLNIFTNANLAGFVATNETEGVITSSYFKGGSLKNETNTAEITSGFVIANKGRINTAYVSGDTQANEVYYTGDGKSDLNIVLSSNDISGFVYTNTGNISDCYTNILLRQSGAFASGFVYENGGNIERCFSTSVFENEQSSNYGFVRKNFVGEISDDTVGIIKQCYFLQDENPDGDESTNDGVNVSVGEVVIDEKTDLTALTKNQFGDVDAYFSDYAYAIGRDISAVWFFNKNANDASNFGEQIFNTSRLELVAPNLLASSQRQLDHIESITSGEITYNRYVYVYKSDSAPLGSVENPIVIGNAQELETYILQENNTAGYNYSYYRLISDIDYSEYIFNSKIYTTKFMGYLEGNFMTISNISFISSDTMIYAGMFAEIGNSNLHNALGTVLNFNLEPLAVSFSNTNAVGALAGKLDGGTVYNVNLLTQQNEQNVEEQVIVVGKYIAGGAIGVAVGNYDIKNLYSQLSAKARNQAISNENSFNYYSNDFSKNSFAGGTVAVLSGSGTFKDGRVDSDVAVIGDKAGLLFGLVDENATVLNADIYMQENMVINAYSYGGFVAGEAKGLFKNIEIHGFDGYFESFRTIPFVAKGVGGVAGIMTGGSLNNVVTNQSIKVGGENVSSSITNLGGVVGCITKPVKLQDVEVDADLSGFQMVGGVAGQVSAIGTVKFVDVKVSGLLNVTSVRVNDIGIGGLVGHATEKAQISLKTSFSENEDYLNADKYLELVKEIGQINNKLESNLPAEIINSNIETTDIDELQSAIATNIGKGSDWADIEQQIIDIEEDDEIGVENKPAEKIELLNIKSSDGIEYSDFAWNAIIEVEKYQINKSNLLDVVKYLTFDISKLKEDEKSTKIDVNYMIYCTLGLKDSADLANLAEGLKGLLNTLNSSVSTDEDAINACQRVLGYVENKIAYNNAENDFNSLITKFESRLVEGEETNIFDKFLDVEGKFNENKLKEYFANMQSKYNVFDIVISSNVTVYNQAININAGAVVGFDESDLLHIVSDTVMDLQGTLYAYDYSVGGQLYSAQLQVSSESGQLEYGDNIDSGSETTQMIMAKVYDGQNATYYCNVGYQAIKGVSSSSGVKLNLFGNAFYPQES